MSQETVLNQIREERKKQDQKWGPEHDDNHTLDEWVDIVHCILLKAKLAGKPGGKRWRLLQAASVLVAAMESLDRPRPVEQTQALLDIENPTQRRRLYDLHEALLLPLALTPEGMKEQLQQLEDAIRAGQSMDSFGNGLTNQLAQDMLDAVTVRWNTYKEICK